MLRHAQRRALLGAAQRLGIGRFQANLIIAAVQHEQCVTKEVATPAEGAGPRWWRLAPFAVVVAVQSLLAWGAWRVFCG